MRLIKILVMDEYRASRIVKMISDADEDGDFEFPFTVRVTEDLKEEVAAHNLMKEATL